MMASVVARKVRALGPPSRVVGLLLGAVGLPACREVGRYSNHGDHYEGAVIDDKVVRRGLGEGVRLCLTLDADRLQENPGTVSTSDGQFSATPLRPLPEAHHDALALLSLGEGRGRTSLFAATPQGTDDGDMLVFLTLLAQGGVEVRMVRGAPSVSGTEDGGRLGDRAVYGVFPLERVAGSCSF